MTKDAQVSPLFFFLALFILSFSFFLSFSPSFLKQWIIDILNTRPLYVVWLKNIQRSHSLFLFILSVYLFVGCIYFWWLYLILFLYTVFLKFWVFSQHVFVSFVIMWTKLSLRFKFDPLSFFSIFLSFLLSYKINSQDAQNFVLPLWMTNRSLLFTFF